MASKSEWQEAGREHLAEGRKRLGPPPAPEEVEALFEGKLSGAEAERVRELLVYYPEIARAMTAPFPERAPGVLTGAELAEDRAKLLARLKQEDAPVLPIRSRSLPRLLAVAAVVVLVGTTIIAYVQSRVEGTAVLLSPDGELAGEHRGTGQSPHQLATETDYVLKPVFKSGREYRSYRLELFDLTGPAPRAVEAWRRVQQKSDGTFPVELSTKGFAEGRYQLVLHGDGESVPLARYSIRLTAPRD